MMKRVLILQAFVWMFFCTAASAADVSGDWALEFTDIMGAQKWAVTFKATGENLDVTVQNAQAGEMKGTGTLTGDEIAFTVTQKGGGAAPPAGGAPGGGASQGGSSDSDNLAANTWSAVKK
jgi:hypothetical protein